MKVSRRLLIGLGVLLVAFAAVAVCRDWSTPREETVSASTPDEVRRANKLEDQRQLILWRIHEHRRIVRELASGRSTLLEAAGQFQSLSEGDATVSQALRDLYPTATEEERVYRWVSDYTQSELAGEPGTAERLATELREQLERGTPQPVD
jgi:hypothetical protein